MWACSMTDLSYFGMHIHAKAKAIELLVNFAVLTTEKDYELFCLRRGGLYHSISYKATRRFFTDLPNNATSICGCRFFPLIYATRTPTWSVNLFQQRKSGPHHVVPSYSIFMSHEEVHCLCYFAVTYTRCRMFSSWTATEETEPIGFGR
uniref:Uncharacterized protein n=1 Tax=Schistocephalus solidus TaxID=70667 RepID=A0A0X3NMB5_SCHSO